LQQKYLTDYSTLLYNMRCIVYILNNIVFDILNFLMLSKKDDDEIRAFLNDDNDNNI